MQLSCSLCDNLARVRYIVIFGSGPGQTQPAPRNSSSGGEALSDPDRTELRGAASDDRIFRLSAAILRINRSLDMATVLDEVVESARALTGARSGVITTLDERGEIQEFVTSGPSPEERRAMVEWPDAPQLFEHLRDLPAPLRVADLPGYLCSLGLSRTPWHAKTLQGTPMHHRGEHLGHFFLADKDDDEAFTAEDEEILVLFASQAAGDRERAHAPRCRAGAGRSRGAHRDLAGRCRGS